MRLPVSFTILPVLADIVHAFVTVASCARGALSEWEGVIELVSDGRSEYVICTADESTASEKTAARELRQYLKLVTGAELPIVSESKRLLRGLMVGDTRAESAFPICPSIHWGRRHFAQVSDNKFSGRGRPRGTLYAVYTFLEETVGFVWTSTRATSIQPTLEFDGRSDLRT